MRQSKRNCPDIQSQTHGKDLYNVFLNGALRGKMVASTRLKAGTCIRIYQYEKSEHWKSHHTENFDFYNLSVSPNQERLWRRGLKFLGKFVDTQDTNV